MIKLIKEYLQTGIDCHLQTTAAQKVVSEAFLLNLELLKGNIKVQKTEHFREREREPLISLKHLTRNERGLRRKKKS